MAQKAPASRPIRFELSNGITIAADAYGEPNERTVLFMHGGGQTRHAWGGSAAALASDGWYALTMDHRGHGESSWDSKGRYTFDHFVEDAADVIAQLDATPVLVGASLGGITALTVETQTDESVCRAIVLVDITPRVETEGVVRIIDFMRAAPEGFASLEQAAEAVAGYLPHRKRTNDLNGLRKNLRQTEDGRFRWHWDPKLLDSWDPGSYTHEDGQMILESRLESARRLRVPTLLVRGRMSDVVSEEGAAEFLKLVSHAEYVDLDGAAHMVAGDRNDAFTGAVREFLEGIE